MFHAFYGQIVRYKKIAIIVKEAFGILDAYFVHCKHFAVQLQHHTSKRVG
jgi:hypothetical protein